MGFPAKEWMAKHAWGEDDQGQPWEGQQRQSLPHQAFLFLPTGEKVDMNSASCAPSCKEASKFMEVTAILVQNPLISKTEVRGFSCCERDLCNGVAQVGRSLWALAGGILLSLGPTLLWALP